MSNKFHIGPNGPGPCNATKRACPIGGDHFDTEDQADEAYRKMRESDGSTDAMVKKRSNRPNSKKVVSVVTKIKRKEYTGHEFPVEITTFDDGSTMTYYPESSFFVHKNAAGESHREDGPSRYYGDGRPDESWHVNGKLHRIGGPALTQSDGSKYYYENGENHRADGGPVFEAPNGAKRWKWSTPTGEFRMKDVSAGGIVRYYEDRGRKHRDDDGPALERPDGSNEYWKHGKKHRENGPAVTRKDGTTEYWVNGKKHREGAPAIEYPDGTKEYWVNGTQYDENGEEILES